MLVPLVPRMKSAVSAAAAAQKLRLKAVERKMMPLVKVADGLVVSGELAAAAARYQEALDGFRAAGCKRPKLEKKLEATRAKQLTAAAAAAPAPPHAISPAQLATAPQATAPPAAAPPAAAKPAAALPPPATAAALAASPGAESDSGDDEGAAMAGFLDGLEDSSDDDDAPAPRPDTWKPAVAQVNEGEPRDAAFLCAPAATQPMPLLVPRLQSAPRPLYVPNPRPAVVRASREMPPPHLTAIILRPDRP